MKNKIPVISISNNFEISKLCPKGWVLANQHGNLPETSEYYHLKSIPLIIKPSKRLVNKPNKIYKKTVKYLFNSKLINTKNGLTCIHYKLKKVYSYIIVFVNSETNPTEAIIIKQGLHFKKLEYLDTHIVSMKLNKKGKWKRTDPTQYPKIKKQVKHIFTNMK